MGVSSVGIQARDFTYAYSRCDTPALNGCTLEISPGEFCLVVGASGSGKSTFMRALCGLIPHAFGGTVAGSFRIAGLDIRDTHPSQLANHVGFVDQDPETQVVMHTVRAELAFPLERRGYTEPVIAREIEEVAAMVGLEGLLDRRVTTLSGGELQRVALAAALVVRPDFLVLDEPTAHLDPVAADDLIWRLRSLHEEFGLTIVLAEHRLNCCLAAADRVLTFTDGALAYNGTARNFLLWACNAAPELLPEPAQLFASLKEEVLPLTVREAKHTVSQRGFLGKPQDIHSQKKRSQKASQGKKRRLWQKHDPDGEKAVFRCKDMWYELKQGAAILRGVSTTISSGEIVVVVGRNGAGKSTLLKQVSGMLNPTRGHASRSGHAALLLQNPNDYFLHDRVADEASPQALERWGLTEFSRCHPRDLSGGQRQRLALAIIVGDRYPELLCLDEPTRGFDAKAKDQLSAWLKELRAQGSAVVVATHDTEFAATFADRILFISQGLIVADGTTTEIFADGRYFTTATAKILGGQALTPQQGAELLLEPQVKEIYEVAA